MNFHKNAFKAHEAAHCANDQDKYWEYNTLLFEHQQALEMAQLKSYARQLKLDTAAFDKCLESGKHTAKVQKNLDAGIAAGVNGTPAFFVNGIGLSGARPFEDFKGIIEGELAKR
ncbi:MAG: DsbA family protein [Deltaproteobacteria bacterium]|nr:DsbA family protein [Deltaproteobacteria bacterium]